jgi:hypothetical protein
MNMRIGEVLRSNNVLRRTLNYADAKHIGILFTVDTEEGQNELGHFIHTLKREGKKVSVLAYMEEQHERTFDFTYHTVTAKDVTFMGHLTSYNALEFIEQPFDYLYCISMRNLPLFDYILAASHALCRIGPYTEGKHMFYELMVGLKQGEGEAALLKGISHYSRAISHNEYAHATS